MRVSDGARKINRHGGAIYVHEKYESAIHTAGFLQKRFHENVPQSPLASIELRDHVYNQLIQLSPATCYRDILILGEKGLSARGLKDDRFSNYGGLPPA
jgi:hypothetical protein